MEELKIIQETENPLFNRKEIKASIERDVTPSNKDIENLISEKFSTQSENIKINKIKGSFGSKNFIIVASIYNSKEDKDNVEGKSEEEIQAEKKTEEIAEPQRGSDDRELIKENVEQVVEQDKSLTTQKNSEP